MHPRHPSRTLALNSTRGGFSVARFRSSTLTIAATSAKIQSRCPAVSKFGGFCRVTIKRADVKPFVCRHRPGRPYLPGSEHQPRAADHHIAIPTTTGPTNPRIFLVFLLVDSGRICVQRFAGPSLAHCLGLSGCQIRAVEQDQCVCSIPRPSKICGPAGTVVVSSCSNIHLCSRAGSTASLGLWGPCLTPSCLRDQFSDIGIALLQYMSAWRDSRICAPLYTLLSLLKHATASVVSGEESCRKL